MNISAEDFRQHFGLLSDEALLNTNRDDLVEMAKAVYDEELADRGLAGGEADEEIAATIEAPAEEQEAVAEALVSMGSFMDLDEARLARGLLEVAGIPSALENEKTGMGALHLMVPASYEEAALQVLDGEISEEELAAQAEAAEFADED